VIDRVDDGLDELDESVVEGGVQPDPQRARRRAHGVDRVLDPSAWRVRQGHGQLLEDGGSGLELGGDVLPGLEPAFDVASPRRVAPRPGVDVHVVQTRSVEHH